MWWDDDLGRPKDEFIHLFKSVPDDRKQRRLNEALKAADEHKVICEALKIKTGFRDAEDHLNSVYFKQIIPAQKVIIDADPSVPGAIEAKASLLLEWFFEERSEEEKLCDYDNLVCDVVCGVAAGGL